MIQKNDIHKLIAKKLSGEISSQELSFLNKWLSLNTENKELYHKFESIWNHSADFSSDFNPDISKAIIKYKKRIEKAQQAQTKKFKIIRLSQLAAAVAILLFFAYYMNTYLKSRDLITVISDSTAIEQIILPDSSVIYLNKNTEIKYHKSFENRIVELEGEAFFEVKKFNSIRFIVETKNTSIMVLGTSFNIKARTGRINTQVSVLTGKVQFSSSENNRKVIIEQNQQATYNKSSTEILTSELKNNNFLVWKTGILSFKNNSLKEVLSTLADSYNIEFNVTDKQLYDLRLTCEFNHQEIDDILEEIEIILPVRISSNNNTIKIEPTK